MSTKCPRSAQILSKTTIKHHKKSIPRISRQFPEEFFPDENCSNLDRTATFQHFPQFQQSQQEQAEYSQVPLDQKKELDFTFFADQSEPLLPAIAQNIPRVKVSLPNSAPSAPGIRNRKTSSYCSNPSFNSTNNLKSQGSNVNSNQKQNIRIVGKSKSIIEGFSPNNKIKNTQSATKNQTQIFPKSDNIEDTHPHNPKPQLLMPKEGVNSQKLISLSRNESMKENFNPNHWNYTQEGSNLVYSPNKNQNLLLTVKLTSGSKVPFCQAPQKQLHTIPQLLGTGNAVVAQSKVNPRRLLKRNVSITSNSRQFLQTQPIGKMLKYQESEREQTCNQMKIKVGQDLLNLNSQKNTDLNQINKEMIKKHKGVQHLRIQTESSIKEEDDEFIDSRFSTLQTENTTFHWLPSLKEMKNKPIIFPCDSGNLKKNLKDTPKKIRIKEQNQIQDVQRNNEIQNKKNICYQKSNLKQVDPAWFCEKSGNNNQQ